MQWIPGLGVVILGVVLALGAASADDSTDAGRSIPEASGLPADIAGSGLTKFVIDDSAAVIGEMRQVQSSYENTLVDIARVYGLGYEEIRLANPDVDTWLPGEGTAVRLPMQFVLPQARRRGLVINIAEYRMYYFVSDGEQTVVQTFPISIGRMDWETPLGRAAVVKKVRNPAWYPPQSVRDEWAADGRELGSRVPPGPNNPLGEYAMRLSIPGYLIHGTNRPAGVGMRVTHGCIRMFPEHIERLFPEVPVNTAVQIINQPYKLGWSGDDLYLEVHPPLEVAAEVEGEVVDIDQTGDRSLTSITKLYIDVTKDRAADVDWTLVNEVYTARLGIPVKIGRAVVLSSQVETVSLNAH